MTTNSKKCALICAILNGCVSVPPGVLVQALEDRPEPMAPAAAMAPIPPAVLSPELNGAVRPLILQAEEVAATTRAAQAFIRNNGISHVIPDDLASELSW